MAGMKSTFLVRVQEDSSLVTSVDIWAKENRKVLGANEAARIAASFGLSRPYRDPEAKSYTNSGKEGDPASADYERLNRFLIACFLPQYRNPNICVQ